MLFLRLASCLAFFISLRLINCLPNGAPISTCSTLQPVHSNIPPEASQSLFRIEPQAKIVGQGQILRIEIPSSIPQLSFKGFIIHARTPNGRVVGRFASSADGLVKLIDCSGVQNTATHANTSPKVDFGLDWQAPSDYLGDIIFNSTVAQDYDKFWVGETSEIVKIVERDQVIPSGISTTRRPIEVTTPNFVRSTSGLKNNDDFIYDGCGDTKTCFGSPDNCVATKSCQTFSAVIVKGDRYIIEMRSTKSAAYVALGLSDDEKMGKDSVVECVNESGSVKAYTSWTIVSNGKFDAPRTGIPQNSIRLIEGRLENGMIYCQVERQPVTIINGIKFDLTKQNYFLLLASGSGIRPASVDYHDIVRLSSREALKLSEVTNVEGRSTLLLRLHGAFMITAWIGTASIGILLARYFKQTWVGSSLCGKDIWFAWHRICMILTWALTLAAFVIIFVEIKGWSSVDNPHAILGTITTVICFFQPIGAFFRPHPGSKKRPLFNWTHWLGGNLAHILAIVTIFFAVKLGKAELPEWMDFILVAYVVFHVIVHFIYSISGCVSEGKGTRVTSFPMTDISQSRSQMIASAKQDAVVR
ncbi:CLUMA_CG013306, isoform A [Clunio marinus]|uniref:CLUMA_CG013306, isoform A n=1 Tax=Clunio marinus TaxID=568069 RepID=A0A1J1IIG7_9DIPT|nr:CLUMA_CG013306, isoform A [Clunio marinus]